MADTLDVLTLAEGRAAVNFTSAVASGTSQDSELAAYITAISRRLDEVCGPVVQRTITSEIVDTCASPFRLTYASQIRLAHPPIVSITTLTEYQGTTAVVLTAETPGTAPTNGYLLEGQFGTVWRRSGGWDAPWYPGRRNVVVTYEAGRAANTAAVDSRFKTAAAITLGSLWRKNQGGGTRTFGEEVPNIPPGFAIPNAALQLLGDELRLPGLA